MSGRVPALVALEDWLPDKSAYWQLPARCKRLAKEALQQSFICIETSAPSRIVVMGPIMVGPTIVRVVGVMIRSIVGPVATMGVTIAPMPDIFGCNAKFEQAQRQGAGLRIGWRGRGEHQSHRAHCSKQVQV
jgi:hypothetical protein